MQCFGMIVCVMQPVGGFSYFVALLMGLEDDKMRLSSKQLSSKLSSTSAQLNQKSSENFQPKFKVEQQVQPKQKRFQ